jgi:general secretion pathway protein K
MAERRQQGVALITAILVVAMATLAAVAMSARQQLDIRRTGNLLHGTQANAYTEGAESWALAVLERDAADSTIDSLDEDWAAELPATLVEGGVIAGRLVDMQGLFNLNGLVDTGGNPDKEAVERFKTLLRNLALDDKLADAVVDWIDPDINVLFPDGAEDQTYLLLKPAYRAANRPMANVSELRLVQGFTPEVIEKLAPFVTALPQPTRININTAPAEVIRTLDPGLTEADAETLVSSRESAPYDNVGAFQSDPVMSGKGFSPDAVSVDSQWFRLVASADIGQARAGLTSLLLRVNGRVRVVQRERRLLASVVEPKTD